MTSASHVEGLFLEHQRSIFARTDRLFAWLMGLQWLGAIVTALVISPRAWTGSQWQTHIHVYAAIFLGGAIVSLPIAMAWLAPGREITRHVVAVAQMLMSALLIHLTGGRIETHFHVFGSLAFLAFYRDWRVLVSASIVVGVDHFVRGMYWPESVYGAILGGEWRWIEHVWWVLFEDVFLFMAIRQSTKEMHAIAERQARAESARVDAERANRVKDEFLATLSHELRTPLTSAFGWISILTRRKDNDEETLNRGLAFLDRNVRAQVKLIDDLLDVSRIVAGKFVLEAKPILLRGVVENAIESVRPVAAAREVELSLSMPQSDLVVNADSQRLQQVIWNLLSNAIKFTPKRGQVRLQINESGDQVVMKVTDTGIGMAKEFLPHVFERFRQADGSITRRSGGLGLGLAIVTHIVERHGGTVKAHSDGLNKGSEFTVTLPAMKNAVILREGRPMVIGPGMLDGLTVLVVEDETDTRELIAMVLRRSGAKVLAAECATRALELIESDRPDVMVSDIGMPDEDGYSLIRKVRTREAVQGGRMPAAALTAYAKSEDREAAIAAGFEGHVAKPIEPERLPFVVAELAKMRAASTRTPSA